MKNHFGYQAPVDPNLRYKSSLDVLTALFAEDDSVDNVGHRAEIIPELYYGAATTKCLREYAFEPEWLTAESNPQSIVKKTTDLLQRYRYVVVGTRQTGAVKCIQDTLERVLLRGPFVTRNELTPPQKNKLAAAELWRFRSGLFNFQQAKALCIHLNSFRRTVAHGARLNWSICEGPGPDEDLEVWLRERNASSSQLHRVSDDLAGFGLAGKLESRIASFKLAFRGHHSGKFSYLPSPPAIEPLFSIQCRPNDESIVSGSSITVTVEQRDNSAECERRKVLLSYADGVSAYPDIALNDSGLVSEHYYFLADEEWSGAQTGPRLRRPSEQAGTLFTAKEALRVMRHLHRLGFKNIRRIQDLRAT